MLRCTTGTRPVSATKARAQSFSAASTAAESAPPARKRERSVLGCGSAHHCRTMARTPAATAARRSARGLGARWWARRKGRRRWRKRRKGAAPRVEASAASAARREVVGSMLWHWRNSSASSTHSPCTSAPGTGCVGCMGCVGCVGCMGCVGCVGCVGCMGCVGCVGCVDCVWESERSGRRARNSAASSAVKGEGNSLSSNCCAAACVSSRSCGTCWKKSYSAASAGTRSACSLRNSRRGTLTSNRAASRGCPPPPRSTPAPPTPPHGPPAPGSPSASPRRADADPARWQWRRRRRSSSASPWRRR